MTAGSVAPLIDGSEKFCGVPINIHAVYVIVAIRLIPLIMMKSFRMYSSYNKMAKKSPPWEAGFDVGVVRAK